MSEQPPEQDGPPPRAYGSSGGGSSKGRIAAIAIGALVIGSGGVAGAILLLGGGDEASTGSAADTAQAFADALNDADCDALEGLATDKLLEDGGCEPDEIEDVDYSDPEVTDESNDTATIEIEASDSAGSAVLVLTLVNDDGAWLVDEIGTDVAS